MRYGCDDNARPLDGIAFQSSSTALVISSSSLSISSVICVLALLSFSVFEMIED